MGSDVLALLPDDEADQEGPGSQEFSDEAMRLPGASDETDKIVELFADKIPHTHGAPVRPVVERQAM